LKFLVRRIGAGPLLRVALIALVIAVAVGEDRSASIVPGAAAMLALELLPAGFGWNRTRLAVELVVASLIVGLSVGYSQAALPLLLITAFRAGDVLGLRAVLVERLACGVATPLWLGLLARSDVNRSGQLIPLLQWWTLGLALGLLAAWANRLQPASPEAAQRLAAQEAARLSGRLASVARHLPLGLDAPAVAQTLLDEIYAITTVDVCAVLLRVNEDTASPLALRGATRLPWRDPIRSEGALHEAWATGEAVVQVRPADADGRRRGSSMLCLPIREDKEMLALIVLERRTTDGFDDMDIARVQHTADLVAPQLQAALRFGEVQRSATVFEREQLAREMHNGVAQDLAFVGFGLDALARHPAMSQDLRDEVQALRTEVTRTLADIRLSIGDLRVGVRADQGLGRVLSAQLQHFGATTGSAVQVELRESTVRLPVEVEQALARLTHELLVDARNGKASTVRVLLESEPPLATYLLEHDGASTWTADPQTSPLLVKLGASLRVLRPDEGDGLTVVVHAGDPAQATPRFAVVPARQSVTEGIGA
jgi:signal transduction histidine kinase